MNAAARAWLLGAVLAAAAGTAAAQTVYRCGPDGREYRQTPCPDGRAVEVGDARSESQRREAASAAQHDAALAERLRRERQAQEARAAQEARDNAMLAARLSRLEHAQARRLGAAPLPPRGQATAHRRYQQSDTDPALRRARGKSPAPSRNGDRAS